MKRRTLKEGVKVKPQASLSPVQASSRVNSVIGHEVRGKFVIQDLLVVEAWQSALADFSLTFQTIRGGRGFYTSLDTRRNDRLHPGRGSTTAERRDTAMKKYQQRSVSPRMDPRARVDVELRVPPASHHPDECSKGCHCHA